MGLLEDVSKDMHLFDNSEDASPLTKTMIKMSNEMAIEFLKGSLKKPEGKNISTHK